jgi:hypothetical protein
MGIKRKYNKLTPPDPADQAWLSNHAAASSLAYKKQVYSVFSDKAQLDKTWRHHRTIQSNMGVKCNIYVNERTGGVMVAYRGTSSAKEAKIDLMVGKEKFFNQSGVQFGEVYRGFGNAFEEILPTLKNELELLYDTTYMRKAPLEFTGHSLGGALSDLSATYFGDLYPDTKVINTTFASPSVGDEGYINHAQQLQNVFRTRVICLGDPISNVKIPGTDFTEQRNVLEITSERKGWKKAVIDITKALGGIVPNIGLRVAEAKRQHSIDTIIDELEDSLQGTRFKTQIVENQELNEEVDNYDKEYKKSQESSEFNNLTDLSKPCQCECHQVDVEQSKKGTPEQQIENRVKGLLGEQTVRGVGQNAVSSTSYGAVLDQTEAESKLMAELNEQNANKLPEDIIQSIESTLNNDLENRKSKLNKLTDEYQTLLKPIQKEDEDLYSFTKKQEKDLQQSVEEIDNRIDLEIEHPERLGLDNPAIKLKEEFSQLYKNIQMAAGQLDSARAGVSALGNTYLSEQFNITNKKVSEEDEQKLAELDQAEQRSIAGQLGNLNENAQATGDIIVNYALIDPNNKEEQDGLPKLSEDERKQVDAALQSQGVTLDQIVNLELDANRNADVLGALGGDVRKLVDKARIPPDTPKETFSKAQTQLREWLNYPDMTPQKLYDLLKKQKLAAYKRDRSFELTKQDNDLKEKTRAELNQKINKLSNDELVTDETTGTVSIKNGFKNLDAEMNRKREFMKKVYANTEVQKIFKTGRITSDQMFKEYSLEKNDDEQLTKTFKDLLGYDPELIKKQSNDKYDKDVFNITTSNKPDSEKYQLLKDAENLRKTRDQYPWLTDNQLSDLMKKYKDDPQLLESVVNEMSQQRWNNIAYEKSGDFQIDPTLTAAVNRLTYKSTEEGKYTDIGSALNKTIENAFNDPRRVQQLFAEWNKNAPKGDNDAINTSRAITSVLIGGIAGFATSTAAAVERMKNEKKAGWYDRYGNKMGVQVPKVFADWAKKTGQYYYEPLKPIDPALQKINDIQTGLQTTFLGISSNEIADLGASFAGKTSYIEQTGIIEDGSNPIQQFNSTRQDYINHLLLQNALGAKNIPGYMNFNRMINYK